MPVEFLKEWQAYRIGAVATLAGGVADALVRRGIARPLDADAGAILETVEEVVEEHGDDEGRRPTNSAGEAFEPPVTKPRTRLAVTRTRKVRA